jgi:putative membrane protein
MKTTLTIFILTMTSSTLILSCSQHLTYQEALDKNAEKIEDSKKLSDAYALVEVKSFAILATRLTELASTKGYSAIVVSMAGKQMDDHRLMTNEVDDLARQKKITLPTTLSDKHKIYLNELTAVNQEDFDKNYISIIRRIHEENIYRLEKMDIEASDEDIRAFAARKLGVLRAHVQEIENVGKDLLQTY